MLTEFHLFYIYKILIMYEILILKHENETDTSVRAYLKKKLFCFKGKCGSLLYIFVYLINIFFKKKFIKNLSVVSTNCIFNTVLSIFVRILLIYNILYLLRYLLFSNFVLLVNNFSMVCTVKKK